MFILKRIDIIDNSVKELLKESDILSSIDCQYIVKHYQTIVLDDSINIIMEFCDDGDLSQFIKSSKDLINEKDIIKIFEQICYGLEYLHSKKIIHRDIKPANIFLYKDGRVKIGDLGVCKNLNTASLANTFVGTPYYLSPELCCDKPYNEKSDIWSLGCVMYEMLAFKKPFEANNPASLLLKIVNDKPENLNINKYSTKLIDLVHRMLDKNVSTRPYINYVIAG
jgi:serine/threonine protein kinase